MITQLWKGVQSYLKAYKFISANNLWVYVIVPGIINLLIFGGVFWFAWEFSSWTVDYLLNFLGYGPEASSAWYVMAGKFMVTFVVRALLLMAYLGIYKSLVLIIMSPVMAYLTEVCMEKMGFDVPEFDLIMFFKNVWRGIRVATVNIVKEFLLLILIGLLVYIPIVGLLSPVLFFVISSYFYGYSMLDYVNEIKGLTMKEGDRYIWDKKWLSISLGTGFYFLLSIPFIGLLLAPSFGVVATVISVMSKKNTSASAEVFSQSN